MFIEIFKTGKFKHGEIETEYTEDDLDKMVERYTHREENQKSPIVKGHPKNNEPAFGWIESLKRNGNILLAKIKDLSSEIITEIKQKHFKNISVALKNKFDLVHVGLLGAVQPKVAGLEPVTMTIDDDIVTIQFLTSEKEIENLRKEVEKYKAEEKIKIMEMIFDEKIRQGLMIPADKLKIQQFQNYISSIDEENKNTIIKELIELIELKNSKTVNLLQNLEFYEEDEITNFNIDENDRQKLHEYATKMMKIKNIDYETAINFIIKRKENK